MKLTNINIYYPPGGRVSLPSAGGVLLTAQGGLEGRGIRTLAKPQGTPAGSGDDSNTERVTDKVQIHEGKKAGHEKELQDSAPAGTNNPVKRWRRC